MTRKAALILGFVFSTIFAQGQDTTLPAHTPLAVILDNHLPMKVGQPVEGALLYPVYAGETELLPARTVVQGTVVALTPDRNRRVHGRLHGDFTPFRIPVVHFTAIELAGGTSAPIDLGDVTNGAPVFSIAPPPTRTGGVFHRAIAGIKQGVHIQMSGFTAPGKGDRLLQGIYANLPYHPQRIEKDTTWSFENTSGFTLASTAHPLVLPEPQRAATAKPLALPKEQGPAPWLLQAFLKESLNSSTTHAGQTIHAVVAQPVFNEDKSVAVPLGAVLTGTVLSVKPARSFHRPGTLRFAFNQLTLAEGTPQNVQTTLAGADAQGQVALDSEGQFKPQANQSIVLPLILAVLATRTLHTEGHADTGEQLGKNATGANGFGLIGSIVGAAAQTPEIAAGIGYYGTALVLYNRFLTHGEEMMFARNTCVLVQTTPRRSSALKPEGGLPQR